MIEYCKLHPEAVSILLVAGLGWWLFSFFKRKEIGITSQSKVMTGLMETISQLKIVVPRAMAKYEKENGKKPTDILDETSKAINRLEEQIAMLEISGSLRTRNWILNKLSSSLNGLSPWLTQANIDELTWILRLELGVVPWRERLRVSLRNRLNKR
jgi:hypothetical protein